MGFSFGVYPWRMLTRAVIPKVRPGVNYNRCLSQAGELRSWVLEAAMDVIFRNGWEFEIRHMDEFKLYGKKFRNDRNVFTLGWDGRDGRTVCAYAGNGVNFDSGLAMYGAKVQWPFGDRWRQSEIRIESHTYKSTAQTSLDAAADYLTVSHQADLLVLFNPVLDVSTPEIVNQFGFEELTTEMSPALTLTKDTVPSVLFYGEADQLIAQGRAFHDKVKSLGSFPDQLHGFFNREPFLHQTIDLADMFPVNQGYIAS